LELQPHLGFESLKHEQQTHGKKQFLPKEWHIPSISLSPFDIRKKKSSGTQILVIEAIVFDETFNFLQIKPVQTGSQPALIDHCWEPAAAAMRDL